MDLEEVVLKAGTAYSEGNYEEALLLYQRAVLGHPHNAVLHANLAAIFTRLSRYPEALQHAETAVSLEPKWGKAFYRKGEALRQMGDHRASLMSFCAALHCEPPTKQNLSALKDCVKKIFPAFPLKEMENLNLQDDPFALLATVGQSLLSDGAITDAIQILTWSLQLDCSCKTLKASVMACMGSAHYKLGNPRRAIDYYEQQLDICHELGTSEVAALRNIAMAAEAAHEWELALRNRRKLFQSKDLPSKEKDEERQTVAELLLQMGRGEEALFMLEMKPPENLRARVNLACVRAITGDGGSALSVLLPLRPSDEELFARAVTATCRCFTDSGRLQEAVNYLEDVMQHATVKGQNHVWKKASNLSCKAHLRMGNIDHAIQLAKRLLRVGRNHGDSTAESDAFRLLAAAYAQQGDYPSTVVLLQNCAALIKIPVERAKLHLEIANILMKDDQDPGEQLELAVDAAECTSDSQVKAQAYSSTLRYLQERGDRTLAEELLQRQKDLLHYDLDGTTRSIIFEDLALMAAVESDSTSSVMALEHGLAEAQEANNIHRELELLERLGDELGRIGKRREAEGFYHRFLALAKQLRTVEHIQRGHTKLARQYKSQGDWDLCGEHARYALTLARLQQDIRGRVDTLLLIGEAEAEKNDLEMAVYALNKAINLAETGQMTELQADGYFLLSKVYQQKGDEKKFIDYQKKFVDTKGKPSVQFCEALLNLAKQAEPVEKVVYLRKCRDAAKGLETEQKNPQLLACFSCFIELNLIDEALFCLKGEDLPTSHLTCLFELPLTKQLPFLLFLNERKGHEECIHCRLLLLGDRQVRCRPSVKIAPFESCDLSPTCKLISAWNWKNWMDLIAVDMSTVDLSILPSDALEMMKMTAAWWQKKTLPECLHQLTVKQQRYLHSFSWTHPQWSTIALPWLAQSVDLLSDQLSPLEKIVFGVISSQTDLVPMWFEELLSTMRSSSFSPFEWDNPRRDVLLAAAFVALAEDDPLSQIWILERAKWELDKHFLGCHGLPPPEQVSSLLFSQSPFTYVFSLSEIDLIWVRKDDEERVDLFLSNLTSSPSFHVHTLSKLLRHRGISNFDPSVDTSRQLLVSNRETDIPAERILPWIRDISFSKRASRRIWLLNLSHLQLKGAVHTENKKKTAILRKFSDSHVVILSPEMTPTVHEIVSSGPAPDVVLATGPLPFDLYSAFFHRGTATILQIENPTVVAIQIFIEQLRMGDPISVCASHFKYKLYGDLDFRIELDATLGQLRRIIREDPDSFLLLARSWRPEGQLGEPWTTVAKGLAKLSKEQIVNLIPLLDDFSTDDVNEMYHSNTEFLQNPLLKQQWALLYNDHLYTDSETIPLTDDVKSPLQEDGCSSDGEYLVVQRLSFNNLTVREHLFGTSEQ